MKIPQTFSSHALSRLFGSERYGVAQLLQATDMVAFDAPAIQLVKVISPKIGVGFLVTQSRRLYRKTPGEVKVRRPPRTTWQKRMTELYLRHSDAYLRLKRCETSMVGKKFASFCVQPFEARLSVNFGLGRRYASVKR